MSADNWGVCPKCGTAEEHEDGEGSLREDYEIGIISGKFYFRYSAFCRRDHKMRIGCGFKFSKFIDEQLNPND